MTYVCTHILIFNLCLGFADVTAPFTAKVKFVLFLETFRKTDELCKPIFSVIYPPLSTPLDSEVLLITFFISRQKCSLCCHVCLKKQTNIWPLSLLLLLAKAKEKNPTYCHQSVPRFEVGLPAHNLVSHSPHVMYCLWCVQEHGTCSSYTSARKVLEDYFLILTASPNLWCPPSSGITGADHDTATALLCLLNNGQKCPLTLH